jgi:hypothetical protein
VNERAITAKAGSKVRSDFFIVKKFLVREARLEKSSDGQISKST